MTALTQYQRLEATGLWRESDEAQRREVVVSMGEASVTISDFTERALAHWSLAAIERATPRGEIPAIYHPDGDPRETLELGEDARDMAEAIDRVLRAIERGRRIPASCASGSAAVSPRRRSSRARSGFRARCWPIRSRSFPM